MVKHVSDLVSMPTVVAMRKQIDEFDETVIGTLESGTNIIASMQKVLTIIGIEYEDKGVYTLLEAAIYAIVKLRRQICDTLVNAKTDLSKQDCRIEELEAWKSAASEKLADAYESTMELETHIAELEAVLRTFEWNDGDAGGMCPGCGEYKEHGHDFDCWFPALLRKSDD